MLQSKVVFDDLRFSNILMENLINKTTTVDKISVAEIVTLLSVVILVTFWSFRMSRIKFIFACIFKLRTTQLKVTFASFLNTLTQKTFV